MMPPKPHYTKSRRLEWIRRMTLVIGARCSDGLIFCADREETTELGGKRSVSKLYDASGDGWSMAIGTSGSGPISEIAVNRIIKEAQSTVGFVDQCEQIISGVLRGVYEQYLWPPIPADLRSQRGISLVIGIRNRNNSEKRIYKSYEEIVKPEDHYSCAGLGQDLGYYFLDRLFGGSIDDPQLTVGECEQFLGFIMKEAKESVGYVGRETETVVLWDDTGFHGRGFMTDKVDTSPHLLHILRQFWRNKPTPSASQTSEPEP